MLCVQFLDLCVKFWKKEAKFWKCVSSWKKLYLKIQTFFLAVMSLYCTILTFFSQFWLFSHNSDFIFLKKNSEKRSDVNSQFSEDRIMRYKLAFVRKKSELWYVNSGIVREKVRILILYLVILFFSELRVCFLQFCAYREKESELRKTKSTLWDKKLELAFLMFFLYSVAETGSIA